MTNDSTTAPQEQEPNNFALRGENKQIHFSSTSISGRPLFNYIDEEDESHNRSFSGDEIDILEAPFGKLITVVIEHVPDSHMVYLALLLPAIILPQGGGEFPIETKAIVTTHRTPFVAPGGHDNGLQVDTYGTLCLHGTASFAFF